MTKIKVEIEVPSDNYCETIDNTCPMCIEDEWGVCHCVLFGNELEIDKNNHLCSIRCNECKQAEELANKQKNTRSMKKNDEN